jgi:hypothetical protein
VFDEAFQVNPFNLLDSCLARLSIKTEEQHNGRKGTLERSRLVVYAPLVAHVALEMLLGGKLQTRELLENTVNQGLCKRLLM